MWHKPFAMYKRTEFVLKDEDGMTKCGSANSATEVLVDFVEGRRSYKEMVIKTSKLTNSSEVEVEQGSQVEPVESQTGVLWAQMQHTKSKVQ